MRIHMLNAPLTERLFVLILLLATVPAFAVGSKQVTRFYNQEFSGTCCFLWNQTVQVTEPTTPKPVIVTWSNGIDDTTGRLRLSC